MTDTTQAGDGRGESFDSGTRTDEADNAANRAKQAAESVLNDIKDHAAEYFDRGRATAQDMTEAIEEHIRRQPVQAVAIAVGIGFALGFLWTRRS